MAEPTHAEDMRACRALLRNGSKSFFAASLLLPRAVREPACSLYAFCRIADDLVDDSQADENAVAHLRWRVEQACAGHPHPEPADRTLARVVARFNIPASLLLALIEGFEWDARGRQYMTQSELFQYCARVAGTVGAMMALVMGVRDREIAARACDLGLAMQLTNIARDVGEDARRGRLYLPHDWMIEAGLDPAGWLAEPVFDDRLAQVLRRLLQCADLLYARAAPGIEKLPSGCRPGIRAARSVYAEIGRGVERRGYDSVSTRSIVSPWRKSVLLAEALSGAPTLSATAHYHVLDEVAALADAVAAAPTADMSALTGIPRRTPQQRVEWLIDLFERLEREDRARGTQGTTG
ncbi:MAG: phytoene/squalene synthase family protein [Pseudomonadota bacterium]